MPKILVIDDDRMVRETLRLILEPAGYQLLFATDGRQGTSAFAEHRPDLVITDILMPEKEGVETIGDLRRASPTLPIIAISGGGRMGGISFLSVAERFGADKVFAKPFEPEDIVAAVATLLRDGRQATDGR